MEENKIIRIGVIGAESTGKTLLCEALAKHYETVWVPEFAREYFNDSSIYVYTANDLVNIAKRQLELEVECEKKAKKYLFCDTTLITLKIWAELEFESIPGFIEEHLSKIKYHHYLITNNDLAWVEDDLRQNKFDRDVILEMNINEVKKLGGAYGLISGTQEQRLESAILTIDQLA
ncbi:MAG: ATP-binding protein [bacterium]|nr:ATP-binding protein [bacterium]